MEYLVICLVAALVSMLTLFSGFGLGTVLMPAFALFFPVPVAIAATAVVHLANNLFKVLLVGRNADFKVVARFAVPGAVAAVAGAILLEYFSGLPPLAKYTISGGEHTVTLIKLLIGVLVLRACARDRRSQAGQGCLYRYQHGLSSDRGYPADHGLRSGHNHRAVVNSGHGSPVESIGPTSLFSVQSPLYLPSPSRSDPRFS